MEVLFVFWIAFAVTCAAIASNKGRSVLGWLIAGFLFGPFALIIVAVISRDEGAKVRAGMQSGEMRACPYCAEPIKSAATKCRHCGSDVPPPPARDIWGRVRQ